MLTTSCRGIFFKHRSFSRTPRGLPRYPSRILLAPIFHARVHDAGTILFHARIIIVPKYIVLPESFFSVLCMSCGLRLARVESPSRSQARGDECLCRRSAH